MTVEKIINVSVRSQYDHLEKINDLVVNEYTPAIKKYFNIETNDVTTDHVHPSDAPEYFSLKKINKKTTIINFTWVRSNKVKFRHFFTPATIMFLIKFLQRNPNNKLTFCEFFEPEIYINLLIKIFPEKLLNQVYFVTSNISFGNLAELNPDYKVNILISQMLLPYSMQLLQKPNNEKLPEEKTFQINAHAVRGTKIAVYSMLHHYDLLKHAHYSYGVPTWDNLKDVVITEYQNSSEIDFLKLCFEKEHEIHSKHFDQVLFESNDLHLNENKYYRVQISDSYSHTYRTVILGVVLEDNLMPNLLDITKPVKLAVGNQTSEKLYFNIYFKNPFVVFHNPNYLEQIKRFYGYKTFSPWIDESYDQIEDDLERYHAGVKEIKRICEMSDQEKIEFSENVKHICEHNYNVMSETIKQKKYII